MPTLISPRVHGLLDAVVVAAFALAPSLLGLEGLAAVLSYGLAAVHLAMTLATDFPAGVARWVRFPLHGRVEFVVGVALIVLALVLFRGPAFAFFAGAGAVILLVWALTDYRGHPRPA